MRHTLAVLAAFAIASLASTGWAQKGKGKSKAESSIPDSVNRQFQWEEKVVGPKDKGVDHQKIQRMQEQARREEAAHINDPPPPPKHARAEGVSAPASATLPTMDIEKPAPAGSVKKPARAPVAAASEEPPRRKDAIDDILAEEGASPKQPATARGSRGAGGLGSIVAVADADKAPAAKPRPAHHTRKAARRKPHKRH